MGSKKQSAGMDACLAKIRQKQKKLQASTFSQNYVAVTQDIEEVRDDRADIRNYKDDVEAFRKTKGHTREFENTENELHLVEDLAYQRKRCLETLLYVSEVENLLQSVQCDMEDRALYLSSRPKVFESVYRDEDVEAASRMHRDCVYALRHGWEWLSDLSRCLDIHTRNAASYHQFHHEVRHTEEDMGTFLAWLSSEPVRKPVKTKDPELMGKHIRLVTSRLLDYQGRVERLCEVSKTIHPINYRKELPNHPIKARALLDYKHNEVALARDEMVTILDIEDQEKWTVQLGDGKEAEVPAIVLEIPPPDPRAFSEARRLREQLVSNWETTVKVLGRQLLQFLSAAAKEMNAKDFQGLSTNQKSDLMHLTNEATALLRGCSSDVGETTQFRNHMTNLRKILSQVKAGQRTLKSAAMQRWQNTHSAFRLYTELMTYIKTFRGDVTATTEAEDLVVRDVQAPETFTSKAYFQRAYPMVDIDSQSPRPSLTSVKAEIYIHERHRGVRRPPTAPPRRKRQLRQEAAQKQEVTSSEPGERRESKNFVIKAVIDPRDKSTLTLFQALGNGVLDQERGVYRNPDSDYVISIPEAIALGYIIVESAPDDGSGLTSGLETHACAVRGVINPSTGEWISAKDAIAAGLLDMRTGKFRNPVTGEELSILDAVEAGLLVVDLKSSARPGQGEGDDATFTSLAMCDVSYAVSGVIDPETGEELTLQRAIELGIIDVEKGLYRNPITGETMSIAEAIQRGLIKASPVDPNDPDLDPESLLTFQQLEVVTQTFKAGHGDVVDGPGEKAAVKVDPSSILLAKMKDKMDVEAKGVADPRGGPMLSLREAVERGILDLARAEYDRLDGVILPLQEAAARGLIEPHVLQEILKVYQECSIGNLIDQGRFDPETSLVLDPASGHSLSLQAAVTNRVLDPETTFYYDVPSQRITSLATASEKGNFDVASGRVVTSQGEELSVSEAEQAAIIMTHVRPEELAEHAEALALLRGVMDTGVVGVKVDGKREPISIEEAVVTGTLSVPTATHCTRNPATGEVRESTPLAAAVKAEKISPEAATALIRGFNQLSLQKAIDSGVLDPRSGQFLTQNGAAAGGQQGGGQGHAAALANKPQYVFLADTTSGDVTTLGAMTDAGKFDPRTGKVKVGPEGKAMTLEEAIAKGLIGASLDPAKFVDTTTSLKDLIDSGKVNPRTTKFVAPNGLEMTVRDAIADGYLTLGSKVCLDHVTGSVRLIGDEGVVRALVEVRAGVDWLEQAEHSLASQARPSEKLEQLKQQVADTKAISHGLQEREPQVLAALRQAEEVVSRRDEAGEDARQQYNKLDLSKKNLKNRFESASREAGLRVERLDGLASGLESFYFRLDEMDQWLDSAIERAQTVTSEDDLDLEEQHGAFKGFVDEVKTKEDDMAQLFKLVDDFRDNKQEVERDQAAYRKCLENLPPIQEEAESGDLDEEVESLEAKFKDVSRECARQMERLTSLLKNKKTFTDLSDRLTSQLPSMKEQIANLKNHEVGRNPEQDARHLEELRLIKADVIGYDRKLKDLGAAGERLRSLLEEAGMGKEVMVVEDTIAEHKESQQALLSDVTELEERADQAVTQQQSLLGRLEGVVTSLEEAEQTLNRREPASLDRERLGRQLQQQREMNAQLSASRGLLDRLGREESSGGGQAAAAQDRLTDLSERLDSAEAKAADRTSELERVEAAMTEYEQRLGDLDSWLTGSVAEVKARSKGGAGTKAAKAKVDALYEAKAEHEGEMAALREQCKELINDDRVTDRYAAKERLAEVEGKWNDLTELLVQQVSLEALSEIDGMLKYLDKAENEINTADPVSVDPDTLAQQLKDHTAFNEDLNNKRNAVKEIINKCNRMLRETTNSQTDEIKSRLDSIRTQADIVCQLSAERLQQLEAALPLARHYGENQAEVQGWLEEMEAELKSQGRPGDSLDQLHKQHDHLKASQQIIADHKPFLDDLNATGLELMDLCGEGDASQIQAKLLTINNRYEALKSQARSKAKELTDAKKKLTVEVSDTMDNLLDELAHLSRTVTNADPVPATPEKLKNEIDENKAVLEDLDNLKPHMARAAEVARNLAAHGVDDPNEVEEVKAKEREVQALASAVREGAAERDKRLGQALRVADKFYDLCADVMSGLRDLKDSLYTQEPPGVDTATILEQQAELSGLEKELEKASELVTDCGKIGSSLALLCGDPGRIEVERQLADLRQVSEDVADLVKERAEELQSAFNHADTFQKLLDSVNSWLPVAEHKLASMRAPSSDPSALHDQMEEIKLFKGQTHPHIVEMQRLNQGLAALRDVSPVAGDALLEPVRQANDSWNDLIRGIADRESKLNDMQVKVGELDHAMDDVISTLEHAQEELAQLDDVKGDPKYIETHMRKLQLLQADLRSQEKTSRKLNKAVDAILARAEGGDSGLADKRDVMTARLRAVQANAKDRENQLHEALRQVKKFLGDLDDMLVWVGELRMELKANTPFGALPETAREQYDKFLKRCEEMDGREKTVQSLLTAGQTLADACRPEHVTAVTEKLHKMRDRWQDTRSKARTRKEKMEEHMANVSEFHDTLKAFTDWLNKAEVSTRALKFPSKLVDKVTRQIEEHEALRAELEAQAPKMAALERSGTYLKYFGRKQDTVYIKNLLVGIRLRWKKLVRRTDERGRLLQQALREDKRFYEAWKSLCDWMDENAKKVEKFVSPGNQSADTKTHIDELKRFEQQLASKHPAFYTATRLGRGLKDRCTKADPEREVLQSMLDTLKDKWNSIRSVVSKGQNKLDEALLTSGRVSDAMQSLMEWLGKAEESVSDSTPCYGDLDTVSMLIEQNKTIQQELAARESSVAAMKAAGNVPPQQLEMLTSLWERVNHLCDVRENKLKDAMKLAEEFQEVVTVMREFLPQAESELKYRPLPEDELLILQLIERHEKFQEEMRSHQDCVDRIKTLAEEILQSCHPNGIRFVKYYLTITQTRWDQLITRTHARADRLQEALRAIQGNAALLEELLAWLTDAHALLATKERDPVPDDLKVVETLLKEHQEFHEEVTSKNADVDRLTKLVNSESHKASPGRQYGSNLRLNEEGHNPRVLALQSKWRTVWRLSVERKKKLQDAYDTLMELESFKNFDFDLWRQRYKNWIQAKKFRITDFFRRQDKDCDGFVTRDEFVSGMLTSKFPSNKTELNAVFDIFDNGRNLMAYKDFIDALKPDRNKSSAANKQKSTMQLIHDEVERGVSSCQCRHQFRAEFIDEGKYLFGEKNKICLVRFLNSTVMVRVGGGWITLDEFLEQNDPCRLKGRTNFDLRDTLLSPDASSSSMASFSSRRGSASGRTSPFPTGASRRRQNDTGYASSNSSAGSSHDSSLRRSRVTSSMVNLHLNQQSSPHQLNRNPEFGSTGSLSRSKRLSTSSSSISNKGRPSNPHPASTPTPQGGSRRHSHAFGRAITPTPGMTSSSSSRSRPTTPTAFTPRTSSTPQRPSSTTPTSQPRPSPGTHSNPRPGSVTPTRGVGGRTRRLPSTPKSPSVR